MFQSLVQRFFTLLCLWSLLGGSVVAETALEEAPVPAAQVEPEKSPLNVPAEDPEPTKISYKRSWLPLWVRSMLSWRPFAKKSHPLPQSRRLLPGLVGAPNGKIWWVIDQLKRKGNRLLSNRLILYGPPGNGKSTLARAIAEAAQWDFMSLSGANIVGSYLGEGAQKIKDAFESAAETYRTTGTGVVIFIDEIDAIARANINYEAAARAEHQVATQALWLCLDKYKNHPGIFFICATNHFDKLDRTFLDRFNTNTVEIGYPSVVSRREILVHYLALYNVQLDEAMIAELVEATDGFSIRSLEDFARDIRIAIEMYGADKVNTNTLWDIIAENKKKNSTIPTAKGFLHGFDRWIGRALNTTSFMLNVIHLGGYYNDWRAKSASGFDGGAVLPPASAERWAE